jgi:hypothetical protein
MAPFSPLPTGGERLPATSMLPQHEHAVQLGMTPIPAALEDMLLTVQALTTVATIAQYLSPYPVIRKIVKQNTTGNFSYVPYLANFLNATLTTVYGFLLRDNFMMLLNSFGVTVTGTYLIMYQRYYPRRIALLRSLLVRPCAPTRAPAPTAVRVVRAAGRHRRPRSPPSAHTCARARAHTHTHTQPHTQMWCLTAYGTCHYATIILEEAAGRYLMGTAQNILSIARLV